MVLCANFIQEIIKVIKFTFIMVNQQNRQFPAIFLWSHDKDLKKVTVNIFYYDYVEKSKKKIRHGFLILTHQKPEIKAREIV